MSEATQEAQGRLFAEMDAKAREVIERKFRVRLDSHQSTQNHDAAWEVYQNASVKLMKAIRNGARIEDPMAYGATVGRNSCRDHWRIQNPGWADLKGRLSRFFRHQPQWAVWEIPDQLGLVCGPVDWKDNWQDKPMAAGNRVAALLDRPRRIDADALPASNVVEHLDSTEWDRLLLGFFEFLKGPARLDDIVSVAGILFGVKGSRIMAFDELGGAEEDGPVFDPPAPQPSIEGSLAMREVMALLWSEIKTMPKRWILPFLLNPPVPKGAAGKRVRKAATEDEEKKRPDRGELGLFVINGATTIAEIAVLLGFSPDQFSVLWRELQIEPKGGPPLDAVPDPKLRFAIVWNHLPLEDQLIARVMGLDSGQKVINLRMVANTHLAKALAAKKIGAGG